MDQTMVDARAGIASGAEGVCGYPPGKRAADVALAAMLLVVAAPVILLAMALVKLTSRGPAIYRQARAGLGGCPFTICKIRTMVQDRGAYTGPAWATACDFRVTPIGRFLRRTRIDEFPQLWNVLRGEMSLVGPRPERPEFVAQLQRAIPRYRRRLAVPPGMTGLAQVHLPPDADLAGIRRKLAYDLYYIRRMGFRLDLKLLLCTALRQVGIPFTMTRVLFRVPDGETIEAEAERTATDRPAQSISESA